MTQTPLAAQTTLALVKRAQSGDETALAAIYERYTSRLRRWVTGRLPDWARDGIDTDDLVQDALLRTMERIDSFEPRHPGALQAYLHQALRNRIRDEIRKVRNRPRVELLDPGHEDPAPGPLIAAIGRERYERYTAARDRLGVEERALIVMRFEWGFSHEEIARDTDKPSPDAARMAVTRALLRLVKEMGP